MNWNLVLIAFAPVILIGVYIYYRDKYEREPIGLLLTTLLVGAIITVPIIFIENFLDQYWNTGGWGAKFAEAYGKDFALYSNVAYVAFVVAALTEEIFKFLAFFIFWKNKNFNELFDGIVYAVFISLGFAAVENLLYVLGNDEGIKVGVMRALTAVPGHALFGVTMGYYFGLAKFYPKERAWKLILALFVPIILHGIYDFILMAKNGYLLLLFIPFIILLWIFGFRRMKQHSEDSVFKEQS